MTDTLENTMSDLPTPRFRIGDVVFRGETDRIAKQHPCPDCLGTREWKVVTPAGETLTIECQRCTNVYGFRDVAHLRYEERVPRVHRLTIGSVRIETDREPAERIAYMCRETGIGSGSVYYERDLHALEEDAQAQAEADAARYNAEQRETPERLRQARLSGLKFTAAVFDQFQNGLWDSWYAYRNLAEEVEAYLKDPPARFDDVKWSLEWRLEHDAKNGRPPIGRMLELLTAAAETGDVSPLKGFLDKFPKLRAVFKDEKAPECEVV